MINYTNTQSGSVKAECKKLIDRNLFPPTTDNKYPHKKTGHYRNKSTQIWDPHPQYEIDAADEYHFELRLEQKPDLVPPKLEVSSHKSIALLASKVME